MAERLVAASAGLDCNQNGGFFTNGKEYGTEKKDAVEVVYWRVVVEDGEAPSCRELAREAGVGRTFAHKIIKEVKERGGIAPVEELKVERMDNKKMGVGVHCLSLVEQRFILDLRTEDPTRSNDSYVAQLLHFSGNIVSSSFISTFFKKNRTLQSKLQKTTNHSHRQIQTIQHPMLQRLPRLHFHHSTTSNSFRR